MGWLEKLALRWGARNFALTCPQCRRPAPPDTFRRSRYSLGEQILACEACGEASAITLWRFEGLSDEPACSGKAIGTRL